MAEVGVRSEVEEGADVGLKSFATVDMSAPDDSPRKVANGGHNESPENGVNSNANGDPDTYDRQNVLDILDFDDMTTNNGKNETSYESSATQAKIGETSEVVGELVEEEVIEMEFEKVKPKLATHTMHCPNCRSEITKVILRRRVIVTPRPAEPIPDPIEQPRDSRNLFGCFSCISFFTFSENGCFNPFDIFGKRPRTSDALPSSLDAEKNPKLVVRKNENCLSMFSVFRREQNDPQSDDEDLSQTDIGNATSLDQFQPHKYVTGSPPIKNGESGASSSGTGAGDPPSDDPFCDPTPAHKPLHGDQLTTKPNPDEILLLIPQQELKIDVLQEHGLGGTPPTGDLQITGAVTVGRERDDEGGNYASMEILKSIVYGGLMEVIASLSVVASAAASDAATMSIVALALAAVIGGIPIIGHNLWNLRDDCYKVNSTNEAKNKYKELLGRIDYFPLHAVFAILSFLVFGMIPPVAYGYSFHETNDKDYTMIAVATASLLCVLLLAIFKAYIDKCTFLGYVKAVTYYITSAVTVSGVSYVVGNLVTRLMEELGLFDTSSGVAMPLFPHVATPSFASF